jgi:hypothetical protein
MSSSKAPDAKAIATERDKFLDAIRKYPDDRELDAIYSTLSWACGDADAPSDSYLEE